LRSVLYPLHSLSLHDALPICSSFSCRSPVSMTARPLHRVWWLHPSALFGGGAVLTLAIAVGTSDWGFQLYSTRKYLEPCECYREIGKSTRLNSSHQIISYAVF